METNNYEVKFESKLEYINKNVDAAVIYIQEINIDIDLFGFKLILFEALTNAIKHGNKNDNKLLVHLSLEYSNNNEFIIKVTDQGEGFDWQERINRKAVEVSKTSGRGIFLMKTYGYNPSYNTTGNILTMKKYVSNNLRKILIIDDDFLNRKVLSMLMSKYGQCDIAINGKEALDAINLMIGENSHYDLICLDIMMPEIDGYQVLKEIRTIEKKFDLVPMKILMTTAMSDSKHILQAFKEQCDGYLIKPITIENLEKYLIDFNWNI